MPALRDQEYSEQESLILFLALLFCAGLCFHYAEKSMILYDNQ